MTKKNIINLVAAFTVSTLAFGSIANAAELSENQEAKLSIMKSEHLAELNGLRHDIINLQSQMRTMTMHEVDFGNVDLLEKQVENKKEQIVIEIAQFHNTVSKQFGSDVARNIYTNEQMTQFTNAREKYHQANS